MKADWLLLLWLGKTCGRLPGVSARVFGPLGRNGINVKAISQGSSELNISIVIQQNDLKKALSILHQSLFSYDLLQLHLYIAGTGAIGGKLLEMIEKQRDYLISQKIALKICGCQWPATENQSVLVLKGAFLSPAHRSLIRRSARSGAGAGRFMERRVAYSRSSGGMKRYLPAQVEEGLQCAGITLPLLGCWLQNTLQTGDLRATRFKSPGMA